MPKKRKKVDADKLITAVESGRPSTEIMDEFGIKTSAQLKALYLDALVNKGKATGIVGARGAKKKDEKEVKVSKRGSIAIPKDMVEEMGYDVGDAFLARKTKAGVSLKKL
jgi:hypothetical protein